MDSYRPGQPPDERDTGNNRRDEAQRDTLRSKDHDCAYERMGDHDRRHQRGNRQHDDSHYQQRSHGGGYQDLDRGHPRGGRRHDPRQDMYYDDDGTRYGSRDPVDPQTLASRNSYSYSDVLRYQKEYADPPNTGEKDKDINDTPNRFLLIRNLKPSLTEVLLAKGLEKLYRGADEIEGGATPLSLLSVMIVKSRDSEESAGYGFAEFYTVADAKSAREKSKKLGPWCTVASQEFLADFPHAGVFPDASVPGPHGRTSERFTFTMSKTGRSHKYYDERYFVKPMPVNDAPAEEAKSPKDAGTSNASKVQTGSKRGIDTLEGQQSKPKKVKKAGGQTKLAQLEHWQNKNAELNEKPIGTISEPQTSVGQSFAVATESNGRCYLCNTAFKSAETLLRHLSESETHVAFLQDEKRKAKGFERLKKNHVDAASTVRIPAPQAAVASSAAPASDQQQSSLQWRNRAAERRQDTAVAPAAKIGFSLKAPVSTAQKSRPSSSGSDSAKPSIDKGRGMLAKFGWSEGQSLGDGSGRTAPIEQSMYAAGVGLGHEGSLRGDAVAEAERRTKDEKGDFLEMTRENARKRYERM